jgi:phosphatidylinositol-3-phosphatase
MKAIGGQLQRTMAAAATLTGKRFSLLVASSLVATSAIVASALTGAGESGALAALLANRPAPVRAVSAPPEPGPAGPGPSPAAPAPSPAPEPSSAAAPAEAPPPPSPSPPPREPEAPAEAPPEAGRVKHVFVISLASPGYEAAFGAASQMPYLAGTLGPQGKLLSGYTLLGAAALPNQIAALSGQPPDEKTNEGCPTYDDCLFPVETLTLADQMSAGRFGWRGYMEGMVDAEGKPDDCVNPESEPAGEPPLGGYTAQRNPFVYFHSLLDLGDCALNDVPLSELEGDLAEVDSTPGYSLISPDLCDAGVPGQCPAGAPSGAAAADAFLAEWVPKILASPAYEKDGLLVIGFDSLDPPDPTTGQPVPATKPRVGALLLSPFVSSGATEAAPYDPYSLLRSVEDLFGLPPLGRAAGAGVKSFAPELLGETGGD